MQYVLRICLWIQQKTPVQSTARLVCNLETSNTGGNQREDSRSVEADTFLGCC